MWRRLPGVQISAAPLIILLYHPPPKEPKPCTTRSTTLDIIKSLPLARRRRTLTLFYDFTRPESERISKYVPSSKTSILSDVRARSTVTNLTKTESRSRHKDTRRTTTRDMGLEASTTQYYDDTALLLRTHAKCAELCYNINTYQPKEKS